MFTPSEKDVSEKHVNDCPYAAYFLMGINKETRIPGSMTVHFLQVGVGIIGKYSGGRQLQSLVNKITPSAVPKGWQYQTRSDALVEIRYRYEKGLIHQFNVDFLLFGKAQVGALQNYLGAGRQIRFGRMRDYYTNLSARNEKFFAFVVLTYWNALVFYDATIQGGVIRSPEQSNKLT